MVETMKMVANPARATMVMRQCFTTPLMEQVWPSVVAELWETSQGAAVVVVVDLVVIFGSLLGTRWIKPPAGLVEKAVVETTESVETDTVVELDPVVSRMFDAEVRVWVPEMGWDVDGSSVLVVAVSVVLPGKEVESNNGAASVVWFVVFVVLAEAEGVLRVWMKCGAWVK